MYASSHTCNFLTLTCTLVNTLDKGRSSPYPGLLTPEPMPLIGIGLHPHEYRDVNLYACPFEMVNPAYVWAGSNLDLNFATLFTWVEQANLCVSTYVCKG